MLIFVKGHYLDRIRSGRKTCTIRPWRRCKLQPGDVLSFNGKVRARITRVVERRIETLTDRDIRADGFESRAAFLRAFRLHYPGVALDRPCFVLYFELIESRRAK